MRQEGRRKGGKNRRGNGYVGRVSREYAYVCRIRRASWEWRIRRRVYTREGGGVRRRVPRGAFLRLHPSIHPSIHPTIHLSIHPSRTFSSSVRVSAEVRLMWFDYIHTYVDVLLPLVLWCHASQTISRVHQRPATTGLRRSCCCCCSSLPTWRKKKKEKKRKRKKKRSVLVTVVVWRIHSTSNRPQYLCPHRTR